MRTFAHCSPRRFVSVFFDARHVIELKRCGGSASIRSADPHQQHVLEMLVGGGIVGGAAFAWLCMRALAEFLRCARSPGAQAAAGGGVVAAGAAIALHGMVDSFLSFTCIYVLISFTLGLAVAMGATDDLEVQGG